jgi:hypothetical protein
MDALVADAVAGVRRELVAAGLDVVVSSDGRRVLGRRYPAAMARGREAMWGVVPHVDSGSLTLWLRVENYANYSNSAHRFDPGGDDPFAAVVNAACLADEACRGTRWLGGG